MTPNRELVLDAAVNLLATGGLRALTHARADERAWVPKGTTSNYFRTRAALLNGVTDWIVQQELPSVNAAFVPRSPEELIDAMCALLEVTSHDRRELTTARLVLFMEASHNSALRDALTRGRSALGATIVASLAEMGASRPEAGAEAIAACFEGLLLHRIARKVATDPRPVFEAVMAGALS
ncbi:DNA-binding transcriptional regulator YbjK [Okibacterium sp. HSC-33S16]|uniref:TetR/AcrR family transcriptional regulator n=1 Tax=Okibacterium sp. HSC-33S16 TaxID=2910965 RepID=UPI00209E33AE|nr:TetR family transcriptional regulator [Okibacterium sp. HSC-33S16]MCP2032488.1 DNA-binding transcriptional regulator YbjK [Okibacterium sp. HSC-33S16]